MVERNGRAFGREPRRVLFVDDDELLREVVETALEAVAGWQVLTTASGADAAERAAELAADAILLDVMMPGVDGPSAVRSIRTNPATQTIPIIFLTAKLPPGEGWPWRSLGLAGVIPKPFDPMTLASQIAELLGWETSGGHGAG